jgi:translation initiation factor IF-3
MGREVLEKFAKETEEYSIIDKKPKMEGRQMIMFLSAKSDN